MPWNPFSVLERERFALRALRACEPFSHTCELFGISRKTGYKWLARYRASGCSAMADQSRRPRYPAKQIPACWKLRVAAVRQARPHWGARKIRQRLRQLHPRLHLPSVRTIGRWLLALGCIKTRQRRARRGPSVPHPGLTVPCRVHQVWTIDFKGHFRTADRVRHDALTIREAKSRYLLDIRLLPNQSDATVRKAMTRVFKREGLPTAIRVDNGSPFGGKGALGLSRLTVWWLRLGIRVEFTRRARPGDNAAHEQMHSRYQAEVISQPASCRQLVQRRSDRWRQDYNHHRPHEALAQRTPSQCYRVSRRFMPTTLSDLSYPSGTIVRRVRPHGDIKWQGRLRYIGRAFTGQRIGLKALGASHHAVLFGPLLIGELHLQDPGGIRPAHWKRQPQTPLKL